MAQSWTIYHREREYAREHGDPVVGHVWAATKDEAERIAVGRWSLPTGAWAVAEAHCFNGAAIV